ERAAGDGPDDVLLRDDRLGARARIGLLERSEQDDHARDAGLPAWCAAERDGRTVVQLRDDRSRPYLPGGRGVTWRHLNSGLRHMRATLRHYDATLAHRS